MKEILYIEVPTPDIAAVRLWLQEKWQPSQGKKISTSNGIRLYFFPESELSIFVWSVQRTTYLKMFRWGQTSIPQEHTICQSLITDLRTSFPCQYPAPPEINLAEQSIFEALASHYPLTVKFFQKIPNGESDLQRAYWWEKSWRENVNKPQTPKQVIFRTADASQSTVANYDLIYIGGALGVIHAAVMAQLGYKILLVERLPFGKMNREWNISRSEFQSLINLGLFTQEEFASLIAKEYKDGFNKFFDGSLPPHLQAKVLHTPTVLNIALNSEQLLYLCGQKLRQGGGKFGTKRNLCGLRWGQNR